jgi:hypothetical protein
MAVSWIAATSSAARSAGLDPAGPSKVPDSGIRLAIHTSKASVSTIRSAAFSSEISDATRRNGLPHSSMTKAYGPFLAVRRFRGAWPRRPSRNFDACPVRIVSGRAARRGGAPERSARSTLTTQLTQIQ